MTNVPKLQTFKRLISYILPFYWAILLSILGFVVNAATDAYIADFFKQIIDAIQSGDQSQQNLLPMIVVLLFVVRGVGSFLGGYFSALISRNLVYQLRVEVFAKLLKLPSQYFLAHPAGTISAKLIFDVEQVTSASTDAIRTLLKDGLTVLALFSYLLYLNWKLTLILFAILPPIFWLVKVASKQFMRFSKGIQESMGDVSHISNEVIKGYRVVKNYGGQTYEMNRFNKVSKQNLALGLKVVVTNSIHSPLIQLLLAFALASIMWLAFRPDVMQHTSAGEFVAYLIAAGLISRPVQNLTNVNPNLQRGLAGAESVFSLLDEPEEIDNGTKQQKMLGNIHFDDVSLTYADGTTAIENFNLTIAAGETVAIVGRSGAGKTSLVNLLTRTLEPSSGAIYIDDVRLSDYKLDSLRAQIAMVNQQVNLFNDSIKHNIAYGQLNKHDALAIESAAKAAFAYEFIQQLPNGFDSQIGAEGLQLSGGQRQRISIARALLKNAPILILDEATSALDNESEHYIQQALDNIMQNRTTLVIAHRLTTIEAADRIVVMDKGRIVEIGNHTELMANNAVYAQMYQRNFDDIL